MESNGYIFDDSIVKYTISGEVVNLNDLSDKDRFTAIAVKTPLNTHTHGRDYHHFVAKLGNDIHLEYQFTNAIILRLFGDKMAFGNKFVKMTTKQTYSFVINNYDLLSKDFQEAMAAELQKISLRMVTTVDKSFTIPQSVLFTFDSTRKNQKEYSKNVYQGYLASAEKRSMGESKFEKFCEESSAVDWFYKNGDKGEEYLSIVYVDNSGSQKLFYPDYVVSVHNEIYIIETKGGFSRGGESQDIDRFSSKKFSVLKNYLNKHSLKGGFVRFDSAEDMLCICTDNYTDDMNTPSWQDINDIIK